MSATRLALATCAEIPGLDQEGRFLRERLQAAGIEAEPAVWDDPAVGWSGYERVLIRSTWDYQYKLDAFRRWAGMLGERLINAPALIEWNISKRYLTELERWGLPTVPSRFLSPGEQPLLPELGAGELVVKPATSAGSKDTARYRAGDPAAGAHVGALLDAGREVLVQPYLDSVDHRAETAVVVLGGGISHAMRKAPLLELGQPQEEGLFRQEEMAPREAAGAELELAAAAVAAVSERIAAPAYARVDMLEGAGGEPLILELELIEPSLFLDFHPPAAERLVALLAPILGR